MKRAPLYNTIASLLFTTWICAQTPSKPSEIEIIFDDSAPSVTQSPETIAPPSTPKKAFRIQNMPLNDFVMAMAQKGGFSYVANPKIIGTVSGRFTEDNPLEMIKTAARANGYAVQMQGNSIELYNSETLAALPQQVYTRQFKYLRVPGKPEDQQKKIQELFKGFLSSDKSTIQFDSKMLC